MALSYLFFFAVALFSGLGVGSAGLPVLYLTLVEGVPQLTAQGINLVFFLCSSGAALVVHLWRTPPLLHRLALMIPLGLLGSYLGTALSTTLPHEILRTLFGAFLIATGAMGLFKRRK